MGKKQERKHYITLNHAVNSAELTPLEKSVLEGAANRIQKDLKATDEAKQILSETLNEAEQVYNHAMRKWRMSETIVDPSSGASNDKKERKPLPGLSHRMGMKEFRMAR